MRFTSERRLDDDVVERRFTLGEIPGILWTPGSATAPASLIGRSLEVADPGAQGVDGRSQGLGSEDHAPGCRFGLDAVDDAGGEAGSPGARPLAGSSIVRAVTFAGFGLGRTSVRACS
jgi:hypothetical protein